MIGLAPMSNGKYDFDVPVGGCITAPYIPNEYIDSNGRVFCQVGEVDEALVDMDFFDFGLKSPCLDPIQYGIILKLDDRNVVVVYRTSPPYSGGDVLYGCAIRRIQPENVGKLSSSNPVDINGIPLIKNVYTETTTNTIGSAVSAAYVNGKIIIGTSKGLIFYSSDMGITWSGPYTVGTYHLYSINYANGKYLIGEGRLNYGGDELHYYYTSTNLTTWTAVTPDIIREVGILSGSTSMVIYKTDAYSIKYSSNLTTWTTPTGLPTYNRIYDSIVFDSKMFLCGNNNLLYVSSDNGATWSNINTRAVGDPNTPNESAYLNMYVHKNVLYLYHVDVPSGMQVFKINPGSNTLIPVKINNRNEYTSLKNDRILTPVSMGSFSYPVRKQQLNGRYTSGFMYTNSYGQLVFYPSIFKDIFYILNETTGAFEKSNTLFKHRKYMIKLCDNTYVGSNVLNGNNAGVYSDFFGMHNISSLPSGFTHLRTK